MDESFGQSNESGRKRCVKPAQHLCNGLLHERSTQKGPVRVTELRPAPSPAVPIPGHLGFTWSELFFEHFVGQAYLDRMEPPTDQTDQNDFDLLEDASAGLCYGCDILQWKNQGEKTCGQRPARDLCRSFVHVPLIRCKPAIRMSGPLCHSHAAAAAAAWSLQMSRPSCLHEESPYRSRWAKHTVTDLQNNSDLKQPACRFANRQQGLKAV